MIDSNPETALLFAVHRRGGGGFVVRDPATGALADGARLDPSLTPQTWPRSEAEAMAAHFNADTADAVWEVTPAIGA